MSVEYLNAIDRVNQKLAKQPSLSEIRKCFLEIGSKFTMLPEHWIQWAQLENSPGMFQDFDETEVSFHLQNIQSQALSCFYRIDFIFTENKRLHNFKLWFRRSTFFDFASTIDSMEKVLSNPLRSKTWLYDCELYSLQPISPKMMAIDRKALEITDLWKKSSLEVVAYLMPDVDLAIEMFEIALGKSPVAVDLWKHYMDFLKAKQRPQKLLNLYSRFCRLFISDKGVRDEYLAEIKKLDASSVDVIKWWIDYIGIERDFPFPQTVNLSYRQMIFRSGVWIFKMVNTCLQYFSRLMPGGSNYSSFSLQNLSSYEIYGPRINGSNVKINYVKDTLKTESRNISPPKFKKFYLSKKQNILSLPYSLWTYMYARANTEIKFKLFQTCKYFFYRGNEILCHNLTISDDCNNTLPAFCERSLYLNPKHLENGQAKFLGNYCITNTLQIKKVTDSSIFSRIVKVVNCVNIRFIRLWSQKFTLNEINLLSCHQIKNANLGLVTVTDSEGRILQVEDLIGIFPNAVVRRIVTNNFTENSSKNLAKIQFPVKIVGLLLHNIPEIFDSNNFCHFLKENAEEDCELRLGFHPEAGANFKQDFENNLTNFMPNLHIKKRREF